LGRLNRLWFALWVARVPVWTTERTARCGVAQREKERVGAGCGKSPAHVQLSAHSTGTRTRMVTATRSRVGPSRISLLIPSLPPHLPSARRGHPSHANRRRRTCLHRNRRHSLSEARHDVIEADGSLEALSLLAAIGPSGVAITDIDLGTENTGIDVAAAARRLWPVVRVMLFSGLPANHTGQEPDPRDVIFRSHFQAIACSELLLTRRRCGRLRRRDGAAAAGPGSGRRGAGSDTNSQRCKLAWLWVSVFPC
jgi:hypothetical protein